MITYQRSSLTHYSVCKTRWRVALFCSSLDDVRGAFEHGLCLRAAEPLAGGWTAVENVSQRIRELCVQFVFERRPIITLCILSP